MKQKAINIFIKSAGVLLLVTAAAKIASSFGTSRIEEYPDPIFLIRFRDSFRTFGLIEAVAAAVCLLPASPKLQAGAIALLSTNFLLYRVGVYWLGYTILCPCLGTLTDALHVPAQVIDTAMKVILIYLLIGGYYALYHLWMERENDRSKPSSIPAE